MSKYQNDLSSNELSDAELKAGFPNNYDDDVQDGIAPEHLKYIDEKEAKEHKLQSHIEEETKDEMLDSNDLNELKPKICKIDKQTNYPPVFTKNRFTSKVADHFICKICENVVKSPLECQSCENLLCKECIDITSSCPFGCDTFKCKPIAKFAANVYLALTLDCKNKPFGCPYSGTIKNILQHEDNCLYVIVQCENSLCDRFILKKDKTKEDGNPLLCSEVCENLIRFSLLIDENNQFESLQNFAALSERCKKLIEHEVKADMQVQYKKIEEKKRETEMFKKKKKDLKKIFKAGKILCIQENGI